MMLRKKAILVLLLLDGVLLLIFLFHKSSPQLSKEVLAKQMFTVCSTKSNKEQCYESEFSKVSKESSLPFLEQTLFSLQNLDPGTRNCHLLAHRIAHDKYAQNPADWLALVRQVNADSCAGGFLHGILEAYYAQNPSLSIDSTLIKKICQQGVSDFERTRACVHMMGHLKMVETKGNLSKAIPVCKPLEEKLSLECYTGAFMEDSFKIVLAEHGLAKVPIRDEARMIQQTDRCSNYSAVAGEGCWVDLAEIYDEFYNYDWHKVYEVCQKAPEKGERQLCYFKAVTLMSVSPEFDVNSDMVSECSPFLTDKSSYQDCIGYVVGGLLFYTPEFSQRAVAVCTNVGTDYKKFCFQKLGEFLKMNVSSKDEALKHCAGTPQEYAHLCSGI